MCVSVSVQSASADLTGWILSSVCVVNNGNISWCIKSAWPLTSKGLLAARGMARGVIYDVSETWVQEYYTCTSSCQVVRKMYMYI